MPLYDFQCPKCKAVVTLLLTMSEKNSTQPECPSSGCSGQLRQVFLKAPGVAVPPQHQAAPNKLGYYGVTNRITGEGITKDTDVRDKPGIRVKGTKK
jgi:putative FmdB family regulatory protein